MMGNSGNLANITKEQFVATIEGNYQVTTALCGVGNVCAYVCMRAQMTWKYVTLNLNHAWF